MQMHKALIIGSGAIGRGFLPWVLNGFNLYFIDSNKKLVTSLYGKSYTSFLSEKKTLQKKIIKKVKIFNNENLVKINQIKFDVIFICIGVRNINFLKLDLSKFNCPIYSLENDPITVLQLKKRYKIKNIYFGVPDVISSSTASPLNLKKNSHNLHTENGILYLENTKKIGNIFKKKFNKTKFLNNKDIKKEWDAKLFLHNTSHCIVAYLGNLLKLTYVHEAMNNPSIRKIVIGSINEILSALKILTKHNHDFLEDYADKEIERFSNNSLFDPITRVAREPLRKLSPNGRIMGAMKMCIIAGVKPTYISIGVVTALKYNEKTDPDYLTLKQFQNKKITLKDIFNKNLKISTEDVEFKIINKNYIDICKYLNDEIF